MRNFLKRYSAVRLPSRIYLGGDTLTMDGTTQTLGLPRDCTIVEIDAETASIYYAINDNAGDATAHGFIPANDGHIVGPLGNLNSLSLWGTAVGVAVAHCRYFRRG